LGTAGVRVFAGWMPSCHPTNSIKRTKVWTFAIAMLTWLTTAFGKLGNGSLLAGWTHYTVGQYAAINGSS